jgi:hypothetical protein
LVVAIDNHYGKSIEADLFDSVANRQPAQMTDHPFGGLGLLMPGDLKHGASLPQRRNKGCGDIDDRNPGRNRLTVSLMHDFV